MNNLPKYEIADGEILFRYCYPRAFPPGQSEIPIAVLTDKLMSCDWKRFRDDPMTSYHIGEGKTRIISIRICEEIRNPTNPKRIGTPVKEWHQDVLHDPISIEEDPKHGENTAHSLISGLKKAAVCEAIIANASWIDAVK